MRQFFKQIFLVIQPAEDGDFGSKVFDLLITALVLLSVVCVFVTTFDLTDRVVRAINILEAIKTNINRVNITLTSAKEYIIEEVKKYNESHNF